MVFLRYPAGPGQGHEGQDAPLAPVVGPEDEHQVLDGDGEGECPEDEGQDPEDALPADGDTGLRVEADAEGVEGARADVPEHHAEGGHGKEREIAAPGCGGLPVTRARHVALALPRAHVTHPERPPRDPNERVA